MRKNEVLRTRLVISSEGGDTYVWWDAETRTWLHTDHNGDNVAQEKNILRSVEARFKLEDAETPEQVFDLVKGFTKAKVRPW